MTALSYGQQRLWYLARLDDGAPAYNVPVCWRLRGRLDPAALELGLQDLLRAHEALRTVYPELDGTPHQAVLAPPTSVLRHRSIDGGDLRDVVAHLAAEPFDLDVDLPTRAHLLAMAPDDHALLLVFSHIAVDGRSLQIVARDLESFYTARLHAPHDAPRPTAGPTYRDYALAQRRLLGSPQDPTPAARTLLESWRDRLRDLSDELPLPVDRRRPTDGASMAGDVVTTSVDAELHRAVAGLARAQRCSVFMLLHAVTALLLTRLGCGTDICLGTVTAGRTRPEYDDLVGFCVNTLALRVDTGSGADTFVDLLHRVRGVDLDAFAGQDLPFDWLVEDLAPRRRPGHHPLFQVMITAQGGGPGNRFRLPGVAVERLRLTLPTAKFDLTFAFEERPGHDGIDLGLEYRTELFDRARIELLAGQFIDVLRQVVARPDAALAAVFAASDRENALVAAWNATDRPPPTRTVPELFCDQAARTPDRIALVDGDRATTFAALARAAAELAGRLRVVGAGTDRPVALCLPTGSDAVVAVLATWLSGAAVLPLDPDDPHGRTEQTLAATDPVAVVVADGVVPPAVRESWGRPVVRLRAGRLVGEPVPPAAAIAPRFPARSLSHLILTSGTTGRPKAVLSEHAGLADHTVNRLLPMCAELESRVGRPLRVALSAPLVFDVVLTQLLSLLGGHTLVTVSAAGRADPRLLLSDDVGGVDLLDITTAQLDVLAGVPELRGPGAPGLLIFGGEGCSTRLWRALAELPDTAAYNVYGVTECSIDSTVAPVAGPTPSLGRPHANATVQLLGPDLTPVPVGAVGEICLGGLGVARGYHGRPALTAQRFVPDPSGTDAGGRVYRTGDRGRFHADGRIAYLGREDSQLKIRGRRVELEEIEHALIAVPGVEQAAVVIGTGPSAALTACFVPAPGADVEVDDLRAGAARVLPSHLVPTGYLRVHRLPLTANGKLDRDRLVDQLGTDVAPAATPGPGLTAVEREIAELWTTLLGRPVTDAGQDFFELGGHSLLALRLSVDLQRHFGCAVPLPAVVSAPTVREQARLVSHAPRGRPASAAGAELVELRAARADGDAAAVVLVHPVGGSTLCYRELVDRLGPVGAVYGLQRTMSAACPDDLAVIGADYAELVADELGDRRVVLAGWSLGGVLAHATAAQLVADAPDVGLVLIDSYLSDGGTRPDALESLAALASGVDPDEVRGIDAILREFGVDPLEYRRCDVPLRRGLASVWTSLLHGHDAYEPAAVPVDTVAAVSDRRGGDRIGRAVARWRTVVGDLDVVPVAGDHAGVLSAPGVSTLADVIDGRAARRPGTGRSGAGSRARCRTSQGGRS